VRTRPAGTFRCGIERAPWFNCQKGNMKIEIREVGLLAVGFMIGAVVAVSLTTTPTRPAGAPAPSPVATGPVLAAASLPPRIITITNIQWEAAPIRALLPAIESFDAPSQLNPLMRQNVDLIDTRYQPDIKLDDLK
jgi:hypothetical protein